MSRLIIHIGLMKTGTTALQHFLASDDAILSEQGVRLSTAFRGPNHIELALAFSEGRTELRSRYGVASDAAQSRLRNRIRTRLADDLARSESVVVTSEQLPMLGTPQELGRLADFAHSLADDVTVVGLIRRADHWLPSSYVEAVVNGRTRALDAEFVQWRQGLLDHCALADGWSTAFGRESTVLLPYLESDKEAPAATLTRFLLAVGLSEPTDLEQAASPGLVRSALGAHATEAMRLVLSRVRVGGMRPADDRARLAGALQSRYPGPPVALSEAASAELERRHLVHSGIDSHPCARGEEWTHWRSQPAAVVRDPPHIPPADVATLVDELRRDGVIRRPSPALLRPVRGIVRRLRQYS